MLNKKKYYVFTTGIPIIMKRKHALSYVWGY